MKGNLYRGCFIGALRAKKRPFLWGSQMCNEKVVLFMPADRDYSPKAPTLGAVAGINHRERLRGVLYDGLSQKRRSTDRGC